LKILEIPRTVGVRSQIQDRIIEHERSDNHLPMQEGTNAKFSIHPRHLDDITGRKERGIFYAEIVNVNRYRKKRECRLPDFDLRSSFLLEIGDRLGPVTVHVDERGYTTKMSVSKSIAAIPTTIRPVLRRTATPTSRIQLFWRDEEGYENVDLPPLRSN